jgi:plasmid stabilization system protein ParE
VNLIYRPRFWFDLEDGVAYLKHEASIEVAIRWHAEVMATVGRVLKQPDLGRIRHELKPDGIRTLVIRRYPRYLLFYLRQKEHD